MEIANAEKPIDAIQELRAFAIGIIFVSHAGIGNYGVLGAWGVSIFIILSGYLRGMKLDEYRQIAIRDGLKFAIQKIKPYYPLYIVTMLVAIPLSIIKIKNAELNIDIFFVEVVSTVLMVRSWIPVKEIASSLNEVAWYLNLYFFLLIITPAAAKAVKIFEGKHFEKKKIVGFVLLLYAIQWINLYVVLDWDNAYWMIYMNPFVRSLEYVMGMGVGRYVSSTYEERTKKGKNKNVILKVRGGVCIAVSVLLYLCVPYMPAHVPLTVPWTLVSLMMVVIVADKRVHRGTFFNKLLIKIGNQSAEIFLIHYVIICYLRDIKEIQSMPGWGRLAVYGAGCWIAVVVWRKGGSIFQQ